MGNIETNREITDLNRLCWVNALKAVGCKQRKNESLDLYNKRYERFVSGLIEAVESSENPDDFVVAEDRDRLRKIVKIIQEHVTDFVLDLQYFSSIRDMRQAMPLPNGFRAMVALKFQLNDDNLTHWVGFKNERICDGGNVYTSYDEIKKAYKKFDGYGFKLVFWEKEEAESLVADPACVCRGRIHQANSLCDLCFRSN